MVPWWWLLCQFFGYMVGANTMLEYLLAGSTVAKGFASYFTVLIGKTCNCCRHQQASSADSSRG